jgi:hypothetical protein
MKLLHLTYHFEFSDRIEKILDSHEIENYARYPFVEAKDRDGRHYGTKVFPGHSSVIQAQVPDDSVQSLLAELNKFKKAAESHRHITAVVLPIEDCLV